MAYNSHNLDPLQKSILTSVIYSDIFDFPLTQDELFHYLITDRIIKRQDFDLALKNLQKNYLSQKNGYFCLKQHEKIIDSRVKNLPEVGKKLNIARRAAFYLSHIPSVLFIGISGGLAMGDVERIDDIDFFIITKDKTIFKSRLLILLILQILNLRRKRQDLSPADKICVNFLIDESSLTFFNSRHDVYTAHEILQIKPLYDLKGTFDNFLSSNMWINNYFQNTDIPRKSPRVRKNPILILLLFILNAILPEKVCKSLQMFLINQNLRQEIVTNHVLAFNPNDYRVRTLKKLRLKLHELGLLTKF